MVPVSESVEGAALFGEDGIGGLGPDERFGTGIVAVEIVVDRVLELGDAPEDATPDAFGRDLGEEALDEVEPGCTRGCEVQLEAPMLGEPGLHLLLHAPLDPLQEADELLGTMARLAFADDEASLDVECREQRCRAMALVVVRRGRGPSSRAGPAACDRAPGSGSSRLPQ